MDRMLNDFVENFEFDFATAIDTASGAMNEQLENMGELACGPEREPAMSRFVDEIEQGMEDSIIAKILNLPDFMANTEVQLVQKDQAVFSRGPERDLAFSSCVDELERGIDASILAESLQISQAINEAADKAHTPDYTLYRDRNFAQAMADFERDLNLDDIWIFAPSEKTYHFARSIQKMEKGLVKIARQYMKKLAS